MSESKYFVLHNAGSDAGWTMLCSNNGRTPCNFETARTRAEKQVKDNPTTKALIVEATYVVQTEFPPVRLRRFRGTSLRDLEE